MTLNRSKKSATQITLKNSYIDYQNALRRLNLDDLVQRRNQLCKSFAKQSVKNASIYFEPNDKLYSTKTRNTNIYRIQHCNTERFNKSALPQMQRMIFTTIVPDVTGEILDHDQLGVILQSCCALISPWINSLVVVSGSDLYSLSGILLFGTIVFECPRV